MAEVKIKLGVDGNELTKGLNQARQQVETFGKKTSAVLSGAGGMKMQKGGMGQMAMQIQDIAVQAQMGTNMVQIMTQQGSQMLSVFGTSGAIVGGVAAVGGALITAAQAGQKAFKETQSAVSDVSKAMEAAGTNADLLQSAFTKLGEARSKISQINESPSFIGATSEIIARSLGLMDSFADRQSQIDGLTADTNKTQREGEAGMIKFAEKQLQVMRLRAAGKDKEAKDLEDLIELEKFKSALESGGYYKPAKDKLTAIEEESRALVKNIEKSKERQEARKEMNKAREAVETFDESDDQTLNRLLQERDALQLSVSAARGDEVKQIEAATRLAQVELKILETKKKIASATADELKRQADAAQDAFEAESKSQAAAIAAAATTSKNASVARADADKELQILRLRADGQTKAADEAARELSIRQSARQIADQQNISYKSALEQAREIADLEDKAAEGNGKKEGRIQGYSQERQGGRDEARARADQRMDEARERIGKSRERGFGGIGEFYENQKNPNFARPQTPMLDASRLRPVQSSVDNNASVTVLNEMKALAERSTKALEAISVV
jgi:hypothetical protein